MATSASTPVAGVRGLRALGQLIDIATGYWNSQVFFAACELRVFDELSDGPMTARELAEKTGVHPEGSVRLLAALEQLGLAIRENDRWVNSELGAYCASSSAVPMKSLSYFREPLSRLWEFLPDALRENSPRWQQAFGGSQEDVFASAFADPARLRRFCELATLLGSPQGHVIARTFDFAPYRCLLDLGGGPGAIGIQIGRAFPHLRGIIMDRPAVCRIADEYVQASGLGDRFTTHAADFFTGPFPAGVDIVLLSSVLHDWNDRNACKILRNCFDLLPPAGVLLISDWIMKATGSGKRHAVFTSLNALLTCETGAGERSEEELRSLLTETGFRVEQVIQHVAMHDLLIASKTQ
jgi:SAM-dependent methyltransferase